jgi:hypothetical protein
MEEIKPITLNIEKAVWDKFKTETVRTITLNEAIVRLIKKSIKWSNSK